MKVYILVTCGYDEYSIKGIYESKEEALKDADFIAEKENDLDLELWGSDSTFRQRYAKHGDVWYEQSQHKLENEAWPEWERPTSETHHGTRMIVEEHETRNLSLQEQCDAINEWQNAGYVHQLTCGKDSNHPSLVPYYDFCWPGIGLKCIAPECEWSQKPNHSILSIVYARYIGNRTQAAEDWRLRQLRQASGDSSPHAGPPDQAP